MHVRGVGKWNHKGFHFFLGYKRLIVFYSLVFDTSSIVSQLLSLRVISNLDTVFIINERNRFSMNIEID